MLLAGTPVFELTINLGNLITIGICVASVAYLLSTVKARQEAQSERLRLLDGRITTMDEKLDKIGEILIVQAHVEGRMNVMDERIAAQGKRVDATMSRVNMILDGEYLMKGRVP